MARITVEDCNRKVPDRFRLAALAAREAKNINSKAEVHSGNREKQDKPTVSALRRIASGAVSAGQLENELLNSLRTKSRVESVTNDSEMEDVVENFDYLPGGTDFYIGEDYSDLDDQIFIDDNSEEQEKLYK